MKLLLPPIAAASRPMLSRKKPWALLASSGSARVGSQPPTPPPKSPPVCTWSRSQCCSRVARQAGRQALDGEAGARLIEAAGIPVPASRLAATPEETTAFAHQVGFPVALKLSSPDILHKTRRRRGHPWHSG